MDTLSGVVQDVAQSLQGVRWDVGTSNSDSLISGLGSIMCGGNLVPFDFSSFRSRVMRQQKQEDMHNTFDSRFEKKIRDKIEKKRTGKSNKDEMIVICLFVVL